jgi:hypothetical protein
MPIKDEISKLKNLPPLEQHVCGTCRFYKSGAFGTAHLEWYACTAMSINAKDAWPKCQGQYWQQKPPFVPVLIRFKRWLVG